MKQIDIAIDPASAAALDASGVQLILCKAVRNSDQATKPLIWSVVPTISQNMVVGYLAPIHVFTSIAVDIGRGSTVVPNADYAVAPGQILAIQPDSGGGGTVVGGGPAGTIGVSNDTHVEYTGGLMQQLSSETAPSPYCFVPVYGSGVLETFTPVDKILLALATGNITAGMYLKNLAGSTVFAASAGLDKRALAMVGECLLVDLTAADTRAVSFDINTGWSWGDGIWATPYPATVSLAKILIESD